MPQVVLPPSLTREILAGRQGGRVDRADQATAQDRPTSAGGNTGSDATELTLEHGLCERPFADGRSSLPYSDRRASGSRCSVRN